MVVRVSRKVVTGFLAIGIILATIMPAYAMQAFRGDFLSGTTPSAVDYQKTTAYLNTVQQTLSLPSPPDTVATGLAAGTTITVLDGPAINTYQWINGTMTLDSSLSLAAGVVQNPIGVAVIEPGMLAVLNQQGVQVYQYTGSGMTANPTLAWTGATNPLTLTASNGQLGVTTPTGVDLAALAQSGWVQEFSVVPSGTPWDASLSPDGNTLCTISGGTLQAYMQTGTGWGTDPNLAVTGAIQPMAVVGNNGQVTAVASGAIHTYDLTGGGWVQNPFLSIGSGLTQPTALAMILGQQALSVLDGSTLKLFEFTGSGLDEVANAQVTGIQQVYVPSATAQSPVLTPSVPYAGAALRPDLILNGGFDTGTTADWNVNSGSWSGSSSVSVENAITVTGPDALAVNVATNMTTYSSFGVYQEVSGLVPGDEYLLTAWINVPSGRSVVWGKEGVKTATQGPTSGWQQVGMVFQMQSGADPAIVFYNANPVGGPASTFYLDAVSLVDLSQTSSANISTPTGTSVTWALSSNGGSTWNSVPWGGTYQASSPSSGWQWQATLSTTNPSETPTIHAPITMLLANPPAAPSPVTASPTDSQGSITSLAPTIGWTFQSSQGSWDSQSAYQVVITDPTTGKQIYNSGKVSILPNPSPPPDGSGVTANDPAGANNSMQVPGSVLAGYPKITVQVRVWDLLDLMSPWASGMFNVFALGPLTITKIYDAPSPDPNPPLPTTQLPVTVLAGAEFQFTLGSTGVVTGITAQFSDGGAPVTLTPTQSTSGGTNTWDGSYYTSGSLPTGTTVTVKFTATSTSTGDQLVIGNIPIVVTDGSVYGQYYVILTN